MARKKRKYKKKNKDALDYITLPRIEIKSETKKGIVVVMIVALGLLSFMGLFGYGGKVGMYLDKSLILAFGFGKWIFPFILLAWSVFLFKKNKGYFRGSHYLGLFIFIISMQSLFHLYYPRPRWEEIIYSGKGGGYIGMFFAKGFYSVLGSAGSWVILLAFLIISLLLMFNTTLDDLFGKKSFVFKIFLPIRYLFTFVKGFFERDYEEEDDEMEEDEVLSAVKSEDDEVHVVEPAFSAKEIKEEGGKKSKVEIKVKEDDEEAMNWEINNIKIDLPLNLLNKKTGKPNSGDVRHNEMVIQRTLENFGIPVEMGNVEVGPTVTQYTLKPSEGIKLSRITNLGNDLALSLAAHPIRIEAPIPGKSLVGIEVPNKVKAMVTLRQVLASKEFKTRKNNLMMALGEDVAGHSWTYDITKMPHLLIAGATNSGKSVCINSVIVSLLYQNDPNDLRFIMVDPKRVELPIYNGIPHLLTPVITDVKKTVNALKWCLNEMDRRFEVLSNAKKRNIEGYNAVAQEKMPYIIFVVDELADLMVVAARDIEAGVIRLTQMARAVGIHLILATQRPSVDVITGLIKANIPTRIAFSVASGVDSKTIIDSSGAEKLLGQGDMLFISPNISKPKRIQGVFVSDTEVKRVVNYIKERSGDFDYVDDITEKQKVDGMPGSKFGGDNERDEYYEDARELIIKTGKASASFLQRKLRVGYARAASLLDELEDAGVIGGANGSKPREVLVSLEDYNSLEKQGISGVNLHNREEAEVPESYLDSEDEEGDSEEEKILEEDNDDNEKKEEEKNEDSEDLEEDSKKENDDDDEEGIYFSK